MQPALQPWLTTYQPNPMPKAKALGVALSVAISASGLALIKQYEGLGQPSQSVQKAYADPYLGWKKATICYGHTANVSKGDTSSLQQCEDFLKSDVALHCKIVYDALKDTDVLLTQGEQDAYCSFAFNLGKFKGTNSVYGRLIKGDHKGACAGLLKYTYSGGVYSKGLYNRRLAEYKLCVKDL